MKDRRVKKSNISKLMQILLFTTIVVVCYSLSKFYNARAGEVTAIIGNPIFTTTLEEIVLEDLAPGEMQNYKFNVSNYQDSNISDISMIYTIEIQSEKHLPLQFELRKVANGEATGENLLSNNITEQIDMGLEIYDQEYELTIIWDETERNYKYSEEIDCVHIILNSYQKSIE